MSTKRIAILLLSCILVLGMSLGVFATSPVDSTSTTEASAEGNQGQYLDSAGNAYMAGEDVSVEKGFFFGGFGSGSTVRVNGSSFEDALFLAGKSVNVENASVGSSLVVACYDQTIAHTTVKGNIIGAAYSIRLEEGVTSKAVLGACSDLYFAGQTEAMHIAAGKVTIDGTINGDANISADQVTIGDHAVITGKLTIESKDEPEISELASVADYDFKKVEKSSEGINPIDKSFHFDIEGRWMTMLYTGVAMLVLALLTCFFVPRLLEDSAENARNNLGQTMISGLLALLLTPILFILLCITVIGAPAGCVILTLYILLLCISVMFAGATLLRAIFPKLHGLLASMLGVVLLEVLVNIPYAGIAIRLLAMIYTLGCVLLVMKPKKRNRHDRLPEVR